METPTSSRFALQSPQHPTPRPFLLESDFPLITRLSVYALGAVDGGRIRKPRDPVAGWLLRHRPALIPEKASSAALTTIRARTALVDHLLLDEVHRARNAREKLSLWVIGGGFDARWHRLQEQIQDIVVEVREVEEPGILQYKEWILSKSPFSAEWGHVARLPKTPDGWSIRPRTGARALGILEGLAGRMTPDALHRLLQRIRFDAPGARLILGLPGYPREEDDQWNHFDLRHTGYDREADTNLAPRGRLLTPNKDELCPGMYPLRTVLLSPRKMGTSPPAPRRV